MHIGDTIFVNHQYLEEFFKRVHPHIQNPYILITYHKDWACPGKFSSYLNDSKIHTWFTVNPDRTHPKLVALPLGMANYYFNHGKIESVQRAQEKQATKKDIFVYINFSINTNKQKRHPAFDYFKNKPYCTIMQKRSFEDYLNDLSRSCFVVSPEGSGPECHRTWESLYMGAIPILTHSPLDQLFEDLPVILVNSWQEVTEDFLKAKYHEFSQRTFNYDKLYADYWFTIIREKQEEARAKA